MGVKRIVSLILLLLTGIGSILYGSLVHVAAVEEEKQREISVAVPTLFGPGESPFSRREYAEGSPKEPPSGDVDPFHTPSDDNARPGNQENPFEPPAAPPAPPGMRLETVTEKYVETSEEPEWEIVWEVTFGGVTRMANGQLKRTYSGKPPALCPT
jgi:hypothetical protein